MKSGLKLLISFAAVGLTVAALWLTNRAVTPKGVTWEDVVAEAKGGGYRLIDTEELWARYQQGPGNILLVDTRQEWEYRTGHVRGAVNFPMEPTWWSRWKNKGAMETLLGSEKERAIIFY